MAACEIQWLLVCKRPLLPLCATRRVITISGQKSEAAWRRVCSAGVWAHCGTPQSAHQYLSGVPARRWARPVQPVPTDSPDLAPKGAVPTRCRHEARGARLRRSQLTTKQPALTGLPGVCEQTIRSCGSLRLCRNEPGFKSWPGF